jgi:hypothetical protein
MAVERVFVLLRPRQLVFGADHFAGVAHVTLLERAPQAVVDHRIEYFAMPHAEPVPDALEQIRAVAHRLHAAGHRDLDVAGRDPLRGEHDGLQAGAAHLVDRERRHVIAEAAAQRGLARRRLAEAGRYDVSENAFLDRLRIDGGAANGLAHDHRAKLRGGEFLQRPEKLPRGRPHRRHDHALVHGPTLTSRPRTTPSPSSASSRARIRPAECSISRRHCASRAVTRMVCPSSVTVDARSTDAPTAVRHANATFSGVSGALRSTAASASGINR